LISRVASLVELAVLPITGKQTYLPEDAAIDEAPTVPRPSLY
jgi:hypothetical protein